MYRNVSLGQRFKAQRFKANKFGCARRPVHAAAINL